MDLLCEVTFGNPAVQLANHTSKTFVKCLGAKTEPMEAVTEGPFITLKKCFQVLREHTIIWFYSILDYWHIPKSLSKPQRFPKTGQISKESDRVLDMFFVKTYNMYSVRLLAVSVCVWWRKCCVMSLVVFCAEHHVCLNMLLLCQMIQPKTEGELEKTYCWIPIAVSSIWDIQASYCHGHFMTICVCPFIDHTNVLSIFVTGEA